MIRRSMHSKHSIQIEESPDKLAFAALQKFIETARKCISSHGFFAVAISGGITPGGMYKLLSEEPYCSEVPWDCVHFFWVDERCVARYDEASNYGMAMKDFLSRVPVSQNHLHPMPAELAPQDGAMQYARELVEFFQLETGVFPVFDLILLGIGKDGHTASLFPEQPSLFERERPVLAVKGGDPCVDRLTFTFPVINTARNIIFLVSGTEKAFVMKKIFSGHSEATRLPALMVRPQKGKLLWLVDRDAASMIPCQITEESPLKT